MLDQSNINGEKMIPQSAIIIYSQGIQNAFYLENRMDLLIVDDKEARKVSRGIDINVIGTVGILILAKKKGLLSLIKDEMECLEKKIDFRLSSSIKKSRVIHQPP